MRRRWSSGWVVAVVIALGIVGVSSVAVASTTGAAAICEKRRGYSPTSEPPRFYDYRATVPGMRRHVQQSSVLPRVLLPSFAYPDGTGWLRFDTYPGGWRGRVVYHAGCTSDRSMQEDHGFLGWEVLKGAPGGVVCNAARSLSCFKKKRLNLGGRIVTQLTDRRASEYVFYRFTSGGITYWVNGQRPRSPGATQDQHNKWVEERIRTARFVGS